MEANQEQIVIETPIKKAKTVKKAPIKKSKLSIKTKDEVSSNIQEEQKEQQDNIEEVKDVIKQDVIIAFDPGFVKCGLAVISEKDGSLIKTECLQIRPEKTKLTQSQVEAYITSNLNKTINSLYNEYNIKYVIIELQLGNFSCTPIQTGIVANLKNDTPFVVQHSKLKLKHPELKDVQNTNTESKQYNQNKQIGRLLAQHIYKEFKEDNFDQCDALLHGLYAFRNKSTIQFVTKDSVQKS